ncbi:hypothetical protein WJ438_10225 [Streptomyces sp. GD-15H]|uniref:hypothetical protein n=1 Tax=Streptomyces sp. GD-15H TaxID=3129112 RepID=UPI0032446E17
MGRLRRCGGDDHGHGAQATPDELREFVKDRVAAYRHPREVWLTDTPPTGPSGKILKREITAPAG